VTPQRLAKPFAAADIFKWISGEPWGMVVNEAANFGLPLVLSDRVGVSGDLVEPGRNGYVVPLDSVPALSEALESLVTDEFRWRQFGRRSLEIISGWNHRAAAEGIVQACQVACGSAVVPESGATKPSYRA
jgi:glycosyltransferase involved in cell wall biosynthesis